MKRTILLLSVILLGVGALSAQEPAQADPPNKPGIPTVQFVFDWRAQNPPRYSIAIDASGRATYRSEPSADPNGGVAPEPYFVEWTTSQSTREKVFDAARKLNYFQGKLESNAKVAQTGIKTLSYKDPSHQGSATYNYSENPSVRELTHIFQSIATTTELGRKLTHDLRYDKLGIDADLKALREQQKQGDAIEIVSILPVLQQIANDTAMLRMAQQRAKDILHSAGLSENGSPTQSQS